jgi:hypothetical protein
LGYDIATVKVDPDISLKELEQMLRSAFFDGLSYFANEVGCEDATATYYAKDNEKAWKQSVTYRVLRRYKKILQNDEFLTDIWTKSNARRSS